MTQTQKIDLLHAFYVGAIVAVLILPLTYLGVNWLKGKSDTH